MKTILKMCFLFAIIWVLFQLSDMNRSLDVAIERAVAHA